MDFENSLEFAKMLDQQDPLKDFRDKFLFPNFGKEKTLYFTGNSLGLQPKKVRQYLLEELEDWANLGVEGHFEGRRPWFSYHELLTEKTAQLVGAKPIEVCTTHSLTTNLHLLMCSFYRPTGKRTKILCEAKAFPSDQYALESQLKLHGLSPEHLICIEPREGEYLIREEDICAKIEELGDSLAMIMWGGVNYYTGQFFDVKAITEQGHKVGAVVGFDLAHAVGNVNLMLNAWGPDFAAWCGYKYLNSSPGGVSGFFVHERHANNKALFRLAGWWGQEKNTRFMMEPGFNPMAGAEGWQLSNAPILGMAAHLASLEIFEEAGMERIGAKRDLLTAYLEFVILKTVHQNEHVLQIITPKNPIQRGAQLSIMFNDRGKDCFNALSEQGVVADWREPNVIRVAPAPLYNGFEEAYWFGQMLGKALQ